MPAGPHDQNPDHHVDRHRGQPDRPQHLQRCGQVGEGAALRAASLDVLSQLTMQATPRAPLPRRRECQRQPASQFIRRHWMIATASAGGQPRPTNSATSCQSTRSAAASATGGARPRRVSCLTLHACTAAVSLPVSSCGAASSRVLTCPSLGSPGPTWRRPFDREAPSCRAHHPATRRAGCQSPDFRAVARVCASLVAGNEPAGRE